jgi:N-acyl-D-aspartate/D-glutamate deacylase
MLYERCILGSYPFEEVIRKMTSEVASRLGIRDRGIIRRGFKADAILLDPSTLKDNSDMAHPFAMCTGLETVMVNGVCAFEKGKLTGSLSGEVVRRNG